MKRTPQLPGVDLGIYVAAFPLLVRNPAIIVVPLLMAVVGVLLARLLLSMGAGGGLGGLTGGIVWLLVFLLMMFGLGAACVTADDAWRHGRSSFDRNWSETRRRGGEILMAAIGVSLILSVTQYLATFLGSISLLLTALATYFLIWTIPAAAIGGVPGSAAIQVSIDRVRANPLSAAVATIVSVALVWLLVPLAGAWIESWLLPLTPGSTVAGQLIGAVLQSIAIGYAALVITKSYTDAAFGRRW